MDALPRGVVLVSVTSRALCSPIDHSPASKFGIDTGAGVIDADYRGVVYILLFNLGERDFEGLFPRLRLHGLAPLTCCSVSVGDRIAQLVLEQIITPDVSEVTVSRFPLLL